MDRNDAFYPGVLASLPVVRSVRLGASSFEEPMAGDCIYVSVWRFRDHDQNPFHDRADRAVAFYHALACPGRDVNRLRVVLFALRRDSHVVVGTAGASQASVRS